jgi:hypothetical protein
MSDKWFYMEPSLLNKVKDKLEVLPEHRSVLNRFPSLLF